LTPARSKSVKPFRVKECQSNFECRLEWVKEAGDHYVVVGRVVAAWVEDRIYTENMSRIMIDPVYDISSKTGEYAGKGSLVT
ncbi:MAG: flavin reductase, partial [Candidatus Omnitrophota bacterium]